MLRHMPKEFAAILLSLVHVDLMADAKSLIGTRFSDKTVQTDKELWPFVVTNDDVSGTEEKPSIMVSYRARRKDSYQRRNLLWSS